MKHIHHIVPKHMGGTNDPSNLKEVSVEEHANLHKELYEKYGKQEDYIAYQGLTGIYSNEEAHIAASALGGKHTNRDNQKKWMNERSTNNTLGFQNGISQDTINKSMNTRKEKKLGFYNPEVQSRLGKIGGNKHTDKQKAARYQNGINAKLNKTGIHDPEVRKAAGKKAGSCLWVTNGIKVTRILPNKLEQFLNENKDYRRGRK